MMKILAACAAIVFVAFGSGHADLIDNGPVALNGQDMLWSVSEGNQGTAIDPAQAWLDTPAFWDAAQEGLRLDTGEGTKPGPKAEDGWWSEHSGSGSSGSGGTGDVWWETGPKEGNWYQGATWDQDWWKSWYEGGRREGPHWVWWHHVKPGVSTPLPPAILLLGPGLAALAAMRRKGKP